VYATPAVTQKGYPYTIQLKHDLDKTYIIVSLAPNEHLTPPVRKI